MQPPSLIFSQYPLVELVTLRQDERRAGIIGQDLGVVQKAKERADRGSLPPASRTRVAPLPQLLQVATQVAGGDLADRLDQAARRQEAAEGAQICQILTPSP